VKILHVIADFGVGGAEVGLARLVNNLHGEKMQHAICSLGPNLTTKKLLCPDIDCFSLEILGSNYSVFYRLAKVLRERAIDIVHVNNLAPWFDVAIAARIAGCKCIETFHGIEETFASFSLIRQLILRTAEKLSAAITVVDFSVAIRLAELTGIDKNRINVIPNAVDINDFSPAKNIVEKEILKKQLGFAEHDFLIGCVAGLRPVKNHQDLIHAFAKILTEIGGGKEIVHLVLVGDGPLRGDLEMLASSLGVANKVNFLGNRNDVPTILKALDLFVLNSRTEGMSYAVIEAMASGVPVVATNVGANVDLVSHENDGLLVEQGNAGQLKDMVLQLILDREQRLMFGGNARSKIENSYSFEKIIDSYKNLYLKSYNK
jgi:glycosyltransferase involved in cell wall biosynthesis